MTAEEKHAYKLVIKHSGALGYYTYGSLKGVIKDFEVGGKKVAHASRRRLGGLRACPPPPELLWKLGYSEVNFGVAFSHFVFEMGIGLSFFYFFIVHESAKHTTCS